MGNMCQSISHAEVDPQAFYCSIDENECFLSDRNNCCDAEEDCVENSDYKRLEANFGKNECMSPVASAYALPRAVLAARGGDTAVGWTHQDQQSEKIPNHLVRTKRAETGLAAMQVSRAQEESFPVIVLPEKEETAVQKGNSVFVHLYDLSETFAQLNAVSIDLMGYGGGLHTGVEVFGVEWSFGTGGISCSAPKRNRNYVYRQTVSMGRTMLTSSEVDRAVEDMHDEWVGVNYDLFAKNCGTFCNALCSRLGVGTLPEWVTRLAEAGAESVTIRRIADVMARNGLIGSPCGSSQQGGSQDVTPVRNSTACDDEFTRASMNTDACVEEVDPPQQRSFGLPVRRALSHDYGRSSFASTWTETASPQQGKPACSHHPIGLPIECHAMARRCRSATFDSHIAEAESHRILRAMSYNDGSKATQLDPFRLNVGYLPYGSTVSFRAAARGGA